MSTRTKTFSAQEDRAIRKAIVEMAEIARAKLERRVALTERDKFQILHPLLKLGPKPPRAKPLPKDINAKLLRLEPNAGPAIYDALPAVSPEAPQDQALLPVYSGLSPRAHAASTIDADMLRPPASQQEAQRKSLHRQKARTSRLNLGRVAKPRKGSRA